MDNLYDSLSYNISSEDLEESEKKYLTETIPKLDKEQKETIYSLILHDYIKANPNTKVLFPFKSKQLAGDCLEIKLDALPIHLQRILYKFTKLATNS